MSQSSDHERHTNFLRLYAQSEVALHTFVRSLVPTSQMAADVMQDVIVVLWEKFESAQDFQGWSFGVAKNIALRHLKTLSRDRQIFDESLVDQLAVDAVTLGPVHERHREALEYCLDKLPAAHRQLVLSAYTNGTRIDQLATRRGQTPMAVYKTLHRIRQVLLECIERKMIAEEYP